MLNDLHLHQTLPFLFQQSFKLDNLRLIRLAPGLARDKSQLFVKALDGSFDLLASVDIVLLELNCRPTLGDFVKVFYLLFLESCLAGAAILFIVKDLFVSITNVHSIFI